ncbi:DUF262 domain-containing protein [Pseudomonas sp. SORT22]|uniref:GmrSD restriction endonuclease domain-containing protein n=1 Tax=Pseudomonas sp. SORT22 TaxID=2813842 RepID=UPI001BCE19D8|nr:DUF262 domain-containing protein [Pseudomonas sp. SORT22]QVM98585.1 DUF262 domain-containing protein [Pseudomonas sp. SORT22]
MGELVFVKSAILELARGRQSRVVNFDNYRNYWYAMDIVRKKLSPNDVGATGAHQSGILIPKSDARGALFPELDLSVKNPDSILLCIDEDGIERSFRFVYYNNKHTDNGTRDEYRITCVAEYFQDVAAKEGDVLEISRDKYSSVYEIKILRGLIVGEVFEFDNTEIPESEEQDIVQYQITSYPADMTISGYLEKDRQDQLIIPDFQRNYVWDQVKASKLIESFMLGLPVPGVFLYKDRKSNKLLIIDGQQRITSALRFMKGAFGEKLFRLKGVHSKWEGKTFEELEESDRFQISDTVLRATIIQQLDPHDDSSIYYIFERLNTGGINLNPMEVRRCVYYGDFIRRLENMNLNSSWRKILGTDEPDKRMRDVELALRCVALWKSWRQYEKPMKGFLNKFLIDLKNKAKLELVAELDEIESGFNRACEDIVDALGEKPFNVYGRLNFALLDSMFVAVSQGCDANSLKEKFDSLLANIEYEAMCRMSTSDEKNVHGRINLALEVIGR